MSDNSQNQVIGDYLKQVRRQVILEDHKKYKLLGVKWYGQGMFLREEKYGKEIKADKLYRVKKGDFVYNRLFAWKSSFAIVEEDFDGCLVSNEFPSFEYDIEKIDPYFLLSYVLQPEFIDYVNRLSGGMSSISRKRFKEEEFIRSTFPNFSIKQQRIISENIRKHKYNIDKLTSRFTEQASFLSLLRQSILQEAIEGKLTTDWRKENPVRKGDPDYDAEALLGKIQAEKEKLIKEGKIKKQKPLAPIKPDEVPFELPEGWVWCRLGEVTTATQGIQIQKSNQIKTIQSDYIRYLYISDFINDENLIYIKNIYPNKLISENNLVMVNTGSTAGTVFYGKSGILSNNLFYISFDEKLLNIHYLYLFLKSCHFEGKKILKGAANPHMGHKKYSESIVFIPPISEQRVIVKRFNRLVAILNELEKQVAERKEQTEELIQAVLREAFEGGM